MFTEQPTAFGPPNSFQIAQDYHLQQYMKLMTRLNVSSKLALNLYNDLVEHYSSSDRHYHDLSHIHDVLNVIESLEYLAEDFDSILLAGWFHDVIYEMDGVSDNELESALYAIEKLQQLRIPTPMIDRVQTLILYTRHRKLPHHIDSKIMVDADLAPLAIPPLVFERNSNQIRAEFQTTPDALFYPARIRILQQFLARERIYLTEPMYNTHEAQARNNISKSLDQLKVIVA